MNEMLLLGAVNLKEIFMFGSVAFVVLCLVELGFLFVCTEWENGVAATISVFVFGAALQFMGNVDVITHLRSHPLHIVAFLAAYVLLGLGWLRFKWGRFAKQTLETKYDKKLADFVKSKGLPEGTKELPAEFRKEWVEVVNYSKDEHGLTVADSPKIRHHKSMCSRWWLMWPFSLLSFVLKDSVMAFFDWMWVNVVGYLQLVSDNVFATRTDIKTNLVLTPEEQAEIDKRFNR